MTGPALSVGEHGCINLDCGPRLSKGMNRFVEPSTFVSAALAALQNEMQSLAAALPEYPVVMEMFGVRPALGPQLMAEIGVVRRFHFRKALVAFAGIDVPSYQFMDKKRAEDKPIRST